MPLKVSELIVGLDGATGVTFHLSDEITLKVKDADQGLVRVKGTKDICVLNGDGFGGSPDDDTLTYDFPVIPASPEDGTRRTGLPSKVYIAGTIVRFVS